MRLAAAAPPWAMFYKAIGRVGGTRNVIVLINGERSDTGKSNWSPRHLSPHKANARDEPFPLAKIQTTASDSREVCWRV